MNKMKYYDADSEFWIIFILIRRYYFCSSAKFNSELFFCSPQKIGFELEFDDDTSIEERDYYTQLFKNVNSVAKERNHCTSCSIHIGTSPSAEYNLKMHSILRVTQCGKCYRFYNSGAFVKGEDGNEIHCRWCGQGTFWANVEEILKT